MGVDLSEGVIADPRRALAEMARVLVDDARLVLADAGFVGPEVEHLWDGVKVSLIA